MFSSNQPEMYFNLKYFVRVRILMNINTLLNTQIYYNQDLSESIAVQERLGLC